MNIWRRNWEKREIAEFSAMVHGPYHGEGCACWQCVGRLYAWVVRTRIERERDDFAVAALSMGA